MSIRAKLALFLSFLFLLLVVNMLFILKLERDSQEKLKWVMHTYNVIIETESFLTEITNAETAQRGYLLTGNIKYLKPFSGAESNTLRHYDRLYQLTSAKPSQTKRLKSIEKALNAKFDELKVTIRLAQNSDLKGALKIVNEDHGKKHMESIRNIIHDFLNVEYSLLEKREMAFTATKDLMIKLTIFEIILFCIIALLIWRALQKNIISPLKKLEEGLYSFFNYLNESSNTVVKIKYNGNDEIGNMIDEINNNISTTKKLLDKKQQYISDIEALNKSLDKKVQKEVEKNRKREQHLIHQSRLAQMGEMISMIAHQWRQPLASISAISGTLTLDVMMDNYKKEFFQERLDSITELSQHLSSTIDDFRNFYKPNKEPVTTTLENIVTSTLEIMQGSLESENIEIHYDCSPTETLRLYDNEMIQVILNILKNSHDNFRDKKIEEPQIKITVKKQIISICDNGGGIPENIIDKIFDPYFSTKKAKDGTGLGLYMSKTIVEEHHDGKLLVNNQDNGVCFTISLNK